MKTCFIFCHGWGFDHHFWDALRPYFSGNDCIYLDLGYFGEEKQFLPCSSFEYIGIGHSLGLMKLLSLNITFKALIGLQSFINFLGFDPLLHQKRKKELEAMQKYFDCYPYQTLLSFYKKCGFKMEKRIFDKKKLAIDLQALSLSCTLPAHTPLFIIASNEDLIVPLELIQDNFEKKAKIYTHESAYHNLGAKHPQFVYKTIMSFLNA